MCKTVNAPQLHSVKESSKNHDVWVSVLFSYLLVFLLSCSRSVRFFAKPADNRISKIPISVRRSSNEDAGSCRPFFSTLAISTRIQTIFSFYFRSPVEGDTLTNLCLFSISLWEFCGRENLFRELECYVGAAMKVTPANVWTFVGISSNLRQWHIQFGNNV